MRFPFARAPVLDSPEIGPPYIDLAVTMVDVMPKHDERRLYVAGVIDNLGGEPPSSPFCVNITILSALHQIEIWDQEFWWYPAHQTFPFRTFWGSSNLHYYDEGGDMYQIAVTADVTAALHDRNRNNNWGLRFYYPFSPRFGPEMGPLRRETRIEGGKRTSQMTLGGKPLGGPDEG